MNGNTIGALASIPLVVMAVITAIRYRNSRSLDQERGEAPPDPPLVSVVIPARNEARNIARCLSSVLTNTYPRLEIIVVDDQSTDGTGNIARDIAATDARVRVLLNTPLPAGWMGKQWACESGARASSGEIILFADADTTQSHDLITRSVNSILDRNADLFSVAGRQELGSFWEKLIQPQIFGLLATRYGGTESVTNSKFAMGKIANGQCLFVKRAAYEELGGHGLVKSHVADDMMMAQRYFKNGKKVVLCEGLDQLSTRMYTSFPEIVHGWGKNVYAGGRDAAPLGWFGRLLFPLMLLSAPAVGVLPAVLLLVSLFVAVAQPLLIWALLTQIFMLIWWACVYWKIDESPFYALISPIGAAVLFYIFLRAVVRGSRVSWKDREYVSA